MTQMPLVLALATVFSLSALHIWPLEEFPTTDWQRKRRPNSDLQMVLHNIEAPPEGGLPQHYAPPLGHLCRTAVKTNLPSVQNIRQLTWLKDKLLQRGIARLVILY